MVIPNKWIGALVPFGMKYARTKRVLPTSQGGTLSALARKWA
jgi:hypothetical protein